MRIVAGVLLLLLVSPAPAAAWGFDAHKLIAERMVALLPDAIRPLFEQRLAYLVERTVDPDLWRNIFEDEAPRHFVDLDYFGKYPFDELPREYDLAIQKFGRAVIHEQGLLPWRTAEIYGKLQREFETLKRDNPPAYAQENIAYYSAVLAHYVGDGHVPLHSVVNYDGQRTGQAGLHSRWEGELFDRTRAQLKLAPKPAAGVRQPRDFMFDVLLASNRLVDGVLAADRKATQGRQFYDDVYFGAFAIEQRSVLEQRLNDSITAVASMIVGAWEAAGRPALPPARTRTPRAIPKPRG